MSGFFLATCAVLSLVGCAEGPMDPSPRHARLPVDDDPGDRVSAEELDFVEMAELLPEFAGYYYDEGGDLVVRVTDLGVADAAVELVAARPIASMPAGGGRDEPPSIRVELADFAFLDLFDWRSAILRSVMDIDGVVSLDIDEVASRLAVGVVDDDVRAQVESVIEAAGVPLDATSIFDTSYPILASTVRDRLRPVTGGLQDRDYTGAGNCTIAFTARDTVGVNGSFQRLTARRLSWRSIS